MTAYHDEDENLSIATTPRPQMTDRKKLREAAMRASPGGWRVEDRCVKSPGRVVARLDWDNRDHIDDANAEFIALANPQTILSLLDDLDRPVGEVQCCMCGKKGLSLVEGDGGPECQLDDGRWTCSADCYDRALAPSPAIGREIADLIRLTNNLIAAAEAFLDHFNPHDLPEDKSQQWLSVWDQVALVRTRIAALGAQP